MKKFMDADFLLKTETAKKLYHEVAEKTPIIDYHCHLSPQEIAEDKHYESITEVWLGGDHYKWRIMRGFGVDEKYITGDADPKEKFMKWAEVMPYCVGNPLYHWTHLELRRYFGIEELLCPENAEYIWNRANELLAQPDFGARGLIKRSNVEIIGTTDDPCDDLKFHDIIKADESFDVEVVPSYRPERALNIWRPEFCGYIEKLAGVVGYEIKDYKSLEKALDERLDFFVARGCRSVDCSLNMVWFQQADEEAADRVFKAKLSGVEPSQADIDIYYSTLYLHLAKKYYENNLVMQIHIAVLRDNNTATFNALGVDTGFDTMSDERIVQPIINLLDLLEREDKLPKTVLYSLNPAHNEALMTLATCFNGHGIAGKIQIGSAWWLNDHIDGMEKHMKALASITLFSKFIGMLTDSRSFLSYTRHEYFRRIVCNIIGTWVENGEAPDDKALLERMVKDICYTNTKNYFFSSSESAMKDKRIAFSEEKALSELKKGYIKAEKLLNDKDRFEKFLEKLENKLKNIPAVGEGLSHIPVLVSMLRSYAKKEYTEVPVGTIIAVVSSLIYWLSPVDLIPDIIPGAGYIDDAAVICACMKLVDSDIEDYINWKNN